MKSRLQIASTLLACLLTAGCLRSLDEVGIDGSTVLHGTVIERQSEAAAVGITVCITDGRQVGSTTITDNYGEFALAVEAEQIGQGWHLLLTADSIYATTTVPIEGVGVGAKERVLPTIVVEGAVLPTLTTDEATGIAQSTAICGGTVNDDGRSHVRRRGVCWSMSPSPTIVNDHAESGSGVGHYAVQLTGLEQGHTYYARAYAENSVGIAYGQEVAFVTATLLPQVQTAAVVSVGQTTATVGGVVSVEGGSTVTDRGICFSSLSSLPTLQDGTVVHAGSGMGNYACDLPDLQPGTTYHYRAFATNAHGTGYGEVRQFTTF